MASARLTALSLSSLLLLAGLLLRLAR